MDEIDSALMDFIIWAKENDYFSVKGDLRVPFELINEFRDKTGW